MSKSHYNKIENFTKEDRLRTIRVLSNETRASMFFYILTFHELTLDKLTNLLSKSKSTIHHHIQQLLEAGLIKKTVKQGSKTIFYTINEQLGKSLRFSLEEGDWEGISPKEFADQLKLLVEIVKTTSLLLQNSLSLITDYFEEQVVYEKFNNLVRIKELMDDLSFIFKIQVLSKEKFQIYERELEVFDNRISQLFKEENLTEEKEKPYVAYQIILPLKEILDMKYGMRKV
ncbi:MAG: ArsR/SmtB family transcription factor [Promethearchaeota archaeon]